MTMAMRGEESAAMLPEPRPDFFAIGLREFKSGQNGLRKKFKAPFAMGEADPNDKLNQQNNRKEPSHSMTPGHYGRGNSERHDEKPEPPIE